MLLMIQGADCEEGDVEKVWHLHSEAQMTSRDRLLAALQRRKPDRLPVTTHHVMPYFLVRYLNGISEKGIFDRHGMDAISMSFCMPLPMRPEIACTTHSSIVSRLGMI